MNILLFILAAILVWFGVDALLLSRHGSPPGALEKDEMMFGPGHRRPIPERARMFVERRYPTATSGSMQFYGWLFIAAGVVVGALGFAV